MSQDDTSTVPLIPPIHSNLTVPEMPPLVTDDWSVLQWHGFPLEYPGLIRISVLGDGSCFFHTICRSYHTAYIGMTTEKRRRFVRDLRHDLAIQLGLPRDPKETNVTWYQSLSRGALTSFAEALPEYSLEAMQHELRYGGAVDNVYNEYVSDILDKDLHLVDALTGDVYVTGDDDDILYKNRPSIVILVWPGHYELLGLHEDDKLITLFDPNHPFITLLHRQRVFRRTHPRGNVCYPTNTDTH